MRTLGIDLAADPKKTAAAVLEWGEGSVRIVHLALGVSDEDVVELFGGAKMTGIDSPLGWPQAFLAFLEGHERFEPGPVLAHDGIAGRRLLAYRDCDRFVTAATGLIPLSVSADPLAHPAMRCAVIQAKIAERFGPQPRDGSGRLAEVYPAASLKLWGIAARKYKGRSESETAVRAAVLDQLEAAAPWLDLAGHRAALASSDDLFDAVIASLSARAVALGLTTPPTAEQGPAAKVEGWIHLPSGPLADLAPAPPG